MTHMLPNASRAMKPWLEEKLKEPRFWDDQFDVTHIGEAVLEPMTKRELKDFMERYAALPHPFEKLGQP